MYRTYMSNGEGRTSAKRDKIRLMRLSAVCSFIHQIRPFFHMAIRNAYSICTCSRSCLDQISMMSNVQQPREPNGSEV